MYSFDDTICAPATPIGSGAISVIRLSGAEALSVADSVVALRRGRLLEAAGYSVHFGTVAAPDGSLLDEVLVSVFRAPHSYTGEDSCEISCHASRYIVETLLQLLTAAGARLAEPGEFTRRAFLSGKMDLAQAESVADLIASQSAAAHKVAISQLKGGFSSELREMRAELLKIVSLMELELDFSEEEVEFADRAQLRELVSATIAHCTRLVDSFKLGNAIKNGIPVAIVGATNAGKSTLLNALLGEDRAIVSDIAGTTRDTIEEVLNLGGVLYRFIDTAGLRETSDMIENLGIERTMKKISEASIVLGMIDATLPKDEILASARAISEMEISDTSEVVLLLNKVDLLGKEGINKIVIELNNIVKYPIIQLSAKNGDGIAQLKATLGEIYQNCLGIAASSNQTLVTNARHVQELSATRAALARVLAGLGSGSPADTISTSGSPVDADTISTFGSPSDTMIPSDLLAQDIREAIYHLGSIVGEISTDEVLGNIFQHFCIGK